MTDDFSDRQQYRERTMREAEPFAQSSSNAEEKHIIEQQDEHSQAAKAVVCPHCGAINETGSKFCLSCGEALVSETCPNCGAVIDTDADYCESCHHYIRPTVCSFCGAHLEGNEAYCPECGSPRGGIVCPKCHTLNAFSFCRKCGEPLTDDAVALLKKVQALPEYKEMMQVTEDIGHIDNIDCNDKQKARKREQHADDLRRRVLAALSKDRGEPMPNIEPPAHVTFSIEEQKELRNLKIEELTFLLEKLSVPEQPKPAKARNYAMATKPHGVRVLWQCNWKHALHSSPCACAKPQLGGKWVIIGADKQELVDK